MDKILYEDCLDKENGDSDITWKDLAVKHGIVSGKILSDRWYRIKSKPNPLLENDDDIIVSKGIGHLEHPVEKIETHSQKESIEIKSDGSTISEKLIKIFETDSKSPKAIMIAHGFDPEQWELVNAKNNMWNMPLKEGDPYVMLQSKITVKPLVTVYGMSLKNVNDFFIKLESSAGKLPDVKDLFHEEEQSGLVLEINLADLHVGNNPTGKEGMTIEEKVERVISDIILRCKNIKLDKIILVQLGDVLHYDTHSKETTGGTRIDSGMDFPTMFDNGAEILIRVIDRLSEIALVEFVNINGNHDRLASYSLGKAIAFYYRDNNKVKVDAGHEQRKFKVVGNNLIHWIHGDMPKKNLTTLPQRETRKEYGESKYCEIHSGHVHHQQTLEADGIIVRFLPSLTSADAWHTEMGYTGSLQRVVSFVWDKQKGLRDIWFSSAD